MKYLIVAIITILSLTQCKTTSQIDDGVNAVDELQIEASSTVNIKGNWTLIKTEIIKEKQSIERFVESSRPYIGKEAIPPVYKNNNGLLKPHSEVTYFSEVMKDMAISEDSILGMNYPLELLQRISYSIDGNLIQIGDDTIKKSITMNTAKDTLYFSYLDHYGLYIEETYAKTSYKDNVLNILKLYKTNFPLLAGAWRLVRVGGGYDGYDAYDITYPFDIPNTIVMTKEELESTLYTDRSYSMLTSGKKQKYFLKYHNSKLWLIPGDWYEKNDLSIHFERIKEERGK